MDFRWTLVMVCSNYSFHEETFDWSTAREKCSDEENSSLVSMETEKEWHFVKNLVKNRRKVSVRSKKCCKRTLILKRVTRVHIFFLDCSTVSNNSENNDIFIEGTTTPRSTPQPLATNKTSTSLRTQLTNTRNKLSEGKIYFDRNFNYTELAKLIRDYSSLAAPGKKSAMWHCD